MLSFKTINTLKPTNEILEMISKTNPTKIKVSNGKILLIEKTNIQSIEPIIYELTYQKTNIILWQYPINEIEGNNFYIPSTKNTYSFEQLRKLLNTYYA